MKYYVTSLINGDSLKYRNRIIVFETKQLAMNYINRIYINGTEEFKVQPLKTKEKHIKLRANGKGNYLISK